MEAFSLTSFTVTPRKLVQSTTTAADNHHHHHHSWCLLKRSRKKVSLAYCQARGETVKSAAVLDAAGSLVLAPNGKSHHQDQTTNSNISVVPYTGPALVDHAEINGDEGIGIVKFLKGKSFLITGATGFLAKVLIEKILRTVPDVGKIFVLIKSKGKESATDRLKNEIMDAEIFKCLRQAHGKSYQSFMLSKLVPVDGNVCESNLGVEEGTLDAIVEEVDVIINSAANTTFDERYDVALDINTGGPSRLMSLAKKCKKLKLFLQVSTAYVNGQRQGRIMEKPFCIGDSIARENFVYETSERPLPTLRVEDELKLVLDVKEASDDNTVAQKMKSLGLERAQKHGWQDTYVFTKAMGEMLIDSMRGEIPVVIIRPSVIESTYRDPFPGWMEGNRMMDPIVLYYGKGQLTGFLVDPNGVLDVVPADMVVNATLAAIAKHGSSGKPGTNVYQIASSVVNPLVFRDLAGLLHHHFESMPCIDSKGRPIHVPEMKLFSSMEDFSSHLWTDASRRSSAFASSKGGGGGGGAGTPNAKLSQKIENICRKSVEQAKYLADIYQPYTFYGGRFDNSNTNRLMECMSEEERNEFGMDVKSIDWKDYISNIHIPGLRRHVMKGRGMCP